LNGSAGHSREVKLDLVDVAPSPVFTRLYRSHDGMFSAAKVLGRMLVLGRIATADVTTVKTETKMNPSVAHLQALFAPFGVRFDWLEVLHVLATVHADLSVRKLF
jgi:hypothetical protein